MLAVPYATAERMNTISNAFDIYLRVREKEGRLYPDDVVRRLPFVPEDHPLRGEWQARAASCERLVRYLARAPRHVNILELGCGNGWLANRIASQVEGRVIGLDGNRAELSQAHRVFADQRDLSWIVTDIFCAPFSNRFFDVIVIASAIQYFADLTCLLQTLIPLLTTEGEIHILDSPLYSVEELPVARERSRRYYEELGYPEMTSYYHHHTLAALTAHNPRLLYVPPRGDRRNPVPDSPFLWVCLRPE